jgi:hypothetical protein
MVHFKPTKLTVLILLASSARDNQISFLVQKSISFSDILWNSSKWFIF